MFWLTSKTTNRQESHTSSQDWIQESMHTRMLCVCLSNNTQGSTEVTCNWRELKTERYSATDQHSFTTAFNDTAGTLDTLSHSLRTGYANVCRLLEGAFISASHYTSKCARINSIDNNTQTLTTTQWFRGPELSRSQFTSALTNTKCPKTGI